MGSAVQEQGWGDMYPNLLIGAWASGNSIPSWYFLSVFTFGEVGGYVFDKILSSTRFLVIVCFFVKDQNFHDIPFSFFFFLFWLYGIIEVQLCFLLILIHILFELSDATIPLYIEKTKK